MRPDIESRLERLEASRARALSLLAPHDVTVQNRAPAPGRWSALQVLHHVVESEAATLGYIRKKMQAGASLPTAGLGSRGARRHPRRPAGPPRPPRPPGGAGPESGQVLSTTRALTLSGPAGAG